MPEQDPNKLFKTYLRQFKSLYGISFGLALSLPVTTMLLGDESTIRFALHPPLGGLDWLYYPAVFFAMLPLFVLWLGRGLLRSRQARFRVLCGAALLTFFLIVIYAVLWSKIVIHVESEKCPGNKVGGQVDYWTSVGLARAGPEANNYKDKGTLAT